MGLSRHWQGAMIPDNSPPIQTRPRMTLSLTSQCVLGSNPAAAERLTLPDGELLYIPQAFSTPEAQGFLEHCLRELPWRQDSIRIAGKTMAVPRLQNWFGEPGAHYSYSGIALAPLPWTASLLEIKARVESLCDGHFNCVLANHYRDGRDSVSWHSDDEPELGEQPMIASVSLGASRRFELRHRQKSAPSLRLTLDHGSLLVMLGRTQEFWAHQVPKEKDVHEPRINLTFRRIIHRRERA